MPNRPSSGLPKQTVSKRRLTEAAGRRVGGGGGDDVVAEGVLGKVFGAARRGAVWECGGIRRGAASVAARFGMNVVFHKSLKVCIPAVSQFHQGQSPGIPPLSTSCGLPLCARSPLATVLDWSHPFEGGEK
jgi:hypothetical protein